MIRILLPSLLVFFLCTCGRAPDNVTSSPKEAVLAATVRYQEARQLLETTARTVPPTLVPTVLGIALEPLPEADPGRYRARRTTALPASLEMGLDVDGTKQKVAWSFAPPFADSIPPSLSRSTSARIAVLPTGLAANESLVMFFEPRVHKKDPHRIQLMGPTSSGYLTLRHEALADIELGDYRVYFVKQQLHKDSTAALRASVQTEYFTGSRELTVTE